MKNFTQKWKKAVGFSFTFFLVALLFLLVGFGTLGTAQSTGKSYELQTQAQGDAKEPSIILHLTAPQVKDKDGNKTDMDVRLSNVYINVGAIYSTKEIVELRLAHGYSDSSFSANIDGKILNDSRNVVVDDKTTDKDRAAAIPASPYNWIEPFELTNAWKVGLKSYSYVKLTARNSNILINEIVFVGERLDEDGETTGKHVVLKAEVLDASVLPSENALTQAKAVADKQKMPSLSSSSFFRLGKEEQKTMMNVSEMKMGGQYVAGDVYDGDTTSNSFALCLATLGTLIFGTSPFGLRFFPMLASFGILAVGYFFVRKLFKSEKAALIFAVLYALAGLSMSLAHFGAPVILGLFFLISSLAIVYRFFENGMKKAAPVCALPLAAAGVLGALAILSNGAFAVPMAGVVALFVAGVVKQHKKSRAALDAAIETAEEEEKTPVQSQDEGEKAQESSAKANVRKALNDYRYKTSAASGVFACAFVIGTFVLSLLFAIPMSYVILKLYSTPAGSSMNIFTIAWKLFAGGFTGSAATNFNFFFKTFTGAGSVYGVTVASINPVALLAALFGVGFAIYRIVRVVKNKLGTDELMRAVIPLAATLVCVVCAAFAGGGIVFVLGAYVFAFMLAGYGAYTLAAGGGKAKKTVVIVQTVALVLLIVLFGLYAVFTFSIPLPATLLAKIL